MKHRGLKNAARPALAAASAQDAADEAGAPKLVYRRYSESHACRVHYDPIQEVEPEYFYDRYHPEYPAQMTGRLSLHHTEPVNGENPDGAYYAYYHGWAEGGN